MWKSGLSLFKTHFSNKSSPQFRNFGNSDFNSEFKKKRVENLAGFIENFINIPRTRFRFAGFNENSFIPKNQFFLKECNLILFKINWKYHGINQISRKTGFSGKHTYSFYHSGPQEHL